MIRSCLLLLLSCCALTVTAQDHTGVWRGILTLEFENYTTVNAILPKNTMDQRARQLRWMPDNPLAGIQLTRPSSLDTKAKLEFQQVDDRMIAVLTSYAHDNSKVIMYHFNVRPKPKEFYKYHLDGIGVLANESGKRAVDLFDMYGNFVETDSGYLFVGLWRLGTQGRRLGSFVVGLTPEQVTMNPELFYQFLQKNKIDEKTIPATRIPMANAINDTLITNASAIHGHIIDNGLNDNDTLSIWLNGKLLEDDIVPGKKPYPFRIFLTEDAWNHLTIRCKSEGLYKGAGVHVSMEIMNKHMKYNLALYKYHQADWIIRRKKDR